MEPFKAGIINDCTPNPFRSLYPKPDFIKKKGEKSEDCVQCVKGDGGREEKGK